MPPRGGDFRVCVVESINADSTVTLEYRGGSVPNVQTLDGPSLTVGDRVLVAVTSRGAMFVLGRFRTVAASSVQT